MLAALEAVFEAAAAERRLPCLRRRGAGGTERSAFPGAGDCSPFPDTGVESRFAADTLACLLRVLQPAPGAFVPGQPAAAGGAPSSWGLLEDDEGDDAFDHGVPEDLRQWASATIGLAGESLGAYSFLALLCDAVQAARQQGSPATEQAIEVCWLGLGGGGKQGGGSHREGCKAAGSDLGGLSFSSMSLPCA